MSTGHAVEVALTLESNRPTRSTGTRPVKAQCAFRSTESRRALRCDCGIPGKALLGVLATSPYR